MLHLTERSVALVLKFLGHVVDKKRMSANPEKVTAITQIKKLSTVTELCHFIGMTNHLGKFSHNLSDLLHPLQALLRKKLCVVVERQYIMQ